MKCQIPRCSHKAEKVIKIQGIFNGIYLDESLHHCGGHKTSVLDEAVDELKKKKIAHFSMVNPYNMAPILGRNAG